MIEFKSKLYLWSKILSNYFFIILIFMEIHKILNVLHTFYLDIFQGKLDFYRVYFKLDNDWLALIKNDKILDKK